MQDSTSLQWTLERSEAGPDLKLFRARFDYLKNPRNQAVERMIVLDSPDAANVVAINKAGQMILARQFRVGTREETLELPGGIVDPGEEHQDAAERELREETGYASQNWIYLGKVASNPVFMNSYIHHWLALDCEPLHDTDLDLGEAVEIELWDTENVKMAWQKGDFIHPHTATGLLLYFCRT
jgi:ADP-ribose pyrophosphatase